MRMWMINPKLMCNKHLLGEHGELHKFKHSFVKGHSILGRIKPIVQIEPLSMQSRHDELVKEMEIRDMNHKSPYEMPCLDKYPIEQTNVKADIFININDLATRCPDCAERLLTQGGELSERYKNRIVYGKN